MSAPEKDVAAASPGIPLDDRGEPVFFEPWQAKAFALTLSLHEQGVMSWSEWAEALGRACADCALPQTASAADHAGAYFTAWLRALEDVLQARSILSSDLLDETAETWQRAAEATPHGKPILYEAGLPSRTP